MNLNTTVNRRRLVRALFFVHRTRSVSDCCTAVDTASCMRVTACVFYTAANIVMCVCSDYSGLQVHWYEELYTCSNIQLVAIVPV